MTGPERGSPGLDVDLHDAGELTPAVAALCARWPRTPSELRGVAHIRGHETDRLAALADGARRPRCRRGRALRRAQHPARAAARRRLPHLRRPPDGPRRRDRRRRRRRRPRRGRRRRPARRSRTSPPSGPGCSDGRASDAGRAATTRGTSSTTTGRAGTPGRAPRNGRRTTTPSTASWSPSTAAGSPCSSTGRTVLAMKSRPLGRKGVVVGDRVRVVGDVSGDDGQPGPHRRGDRAEHRAAPYRGRRRPRRADHRGQRRPARGRHRAGRPGAAAAADRPGAGRGVRRRDAAAAVPDQVRPGRPRDFLSTYRSLGVPWVVTQRGGDLDRAARPATRPDQRADRLQRGRQVDAGQRPGPRARCATSASSTRSPAAAGTPRRRRTCWSSPASGEGWIIDTPGIRSFGLAHVQPEDLIEAFPDLDEMTEDCPRGCTHGDDEPECGLDEAVEAGRGRPGPGLVVPAAAGRPERPATTTAAPSHRLRAGVAGEDGVDERRERASDHHERQRAGCGAPRCGGAARPPGSSTAAKPETTSRSVSAELLVVVDQVLELGAGDAAEPVAVEEVLAAQVGRPDRTRRRSAPGPGSAPAQPVAPRRERRRRRAGQGRQRPEDDRRVHDEHVQR